MKTKINKTLVETTTKPIEELSTGKKSKKSTKASSLVSTQSDSGVELLFEDIKEDWLKDLLPNYSGEGYYRLKDLCVVVFKLNKKFNCLMGNRKTFNITQFKKDCAHLGSLPVHK